MIPACAICARTDGVTYTDAYGWRCDMHRSDLPARVMGALEARLSSKSTPTMPDWTEDSVRSVLATCVDAEWMSLPGNGRSFGVGDRLTACVVLGSRGGEPTSSVGVVWVPDVPLVEDECGYVVARPSVAVWQHGPALSPSDIRPAMLALRSLVIAGHGAAAWPWPSREVTDE